MLRVPLSTLYGCINAVLQDHSTEPDEEVILLINLKYNDLNNSKPHSEQTDGVSDNMESEFKENQWFGQKLTKKLNEFFESISLPVMAEHMPFCKYRVNNTMWISYEVGYINMAPQEIAQNVEMAISCIESCLDNESDIIRSLLLKSSSGQPYMLF